MAKVAKKHPSKRNGVSKSQAIRDMRNRLGRQARGRDVIEALGKQGIEVSPALVSNVIARDSRRKPRRSVARVKAVARASNGAKFSIEQLLEAKQLVKSTGSVEDAKLALQALARLVD